jgi:hypothetical protein
MRRFCSDKRDQLKRDQLKTEVPRNIEGAGVANCDIELILMVFAQSRFFRSSRFTRISTF